jgi:two-component system, OmpR family, phosphate regulon sensor histidine kinase PhoR
VQNWRTELNRLFIILVASGLIGLFFGQITLAMLLALLSYALLNIFELRRFNNWLAKSPEQKDSDPPVSKGLWGDIFDGIYRLQKQERKASNYLGNILGKAQESSAALEIAVIMIDGQNNLDWWNQASENFLGIKFPDDRNQSVTNLIRDPRFAEYFHSEQYDETLKMESPVDSNIILEFQIALFGEHERLMIVRDITQLHRLEMMRKDFVGNVSHELGTPITVIKGYLEAILDNMDGIDSKWRKPVEQMRQQSLRMENIIRDLLLLSSLETKTLPKQQESIRVSKLFSEIENDTLQMFSDKNHTFQIDCDGELRIRGKYSELYSAISNLVVNAAKYTEANGTIALRANQSGTHIEIIIEDNGIGIESNHIPRLTERFYRVDVSRSTDTGGTGLGLAIVKHILARHGGDLEIKSEYGKGSRFICRLPLSRLLSPDEELPESEDPEKESSFNN